jgi:Xaa-Pro aminopeptidase
MQVAEEISLKLQYLRQTLQEVDVAAVRLRGIDWFAWATAGGSNAVLLAAETGVAEVLVTPTDAWILTNEIEAQRLQDEEVSPVLGESLYQMVVHPWAEGDRQTQFVAEVTYGGKVLSDRPTDEELPLPNSLRFQRQIFLPSELDRYRQVGKLASAAITEVLTQAQPDWTEQQLAGVGASALWQRGLQPALVLAAGNRRLPLYRHPLPTAEAIGNQAMLVFCARGHGLIVSLTRFVNFGRLSAQQRQLHRTIAAVEAVVLDQSQPGTALNQVYAALAQAYEQQGYPNAIREHHQGGTAGYGAREVIATPTSRDRLADHMVVAWNPSIPGAKIEDTFVINGEHGLENLSFDPQFPHIEIVGRLRPVPLERE